jgi:hypothetical protein
VLFSVAVMTAGVLEPTGDGVTVKLAVVAPELTITEVGTEADELLLESATLVLLVAATFRVTVQVDFAGAVMLAGLQVRFVGTGAGGSKVRENVFEVLFSLAVMTAGVLELTADGVTVKLAAVAPELTVTEAGTEAEPVLLESATLVLLVGATFSVTVQVEVAGAVMLAGLHFRLVGTGAGGSRVTENVFEVPFSVAVITAGVLEVTGDGVTVKLAVVEPELTVTEAGTEPELVLLESANLVLLAGATFRVTEQAEVAGAVILVGLQFRSVGTGAGGSKVRENVLDVLFRVAVMTAGVLELAGDGVTVKLAVVVPELTVTEAGTEADELPLESATLVLLVGATFRVTVQVEVAGAITVAGLHVRRVGTGRIGWLMVTAAPLTVTAIDVPIPLDAEAPPSVTGDEVAVVLPEI